MGRFVVTLGALVLSCLIWSTASPAAAAGGWGDVVGAIVWGGDKVPEPEKLKVDKDEKSCLAKGPLFSDRFVINGKNKGVRWVMVWLIDPEGKAIPIHPDYPTAAAVKGTKVTIDQPCCMFEPHLVGLREGQVLVAKNTADIVHNYKLDSIGKNPNVNILIPAGKEVEIDPWFAEKSATTGSCTIHPWMKMYVRAFKHPYFAVTDADGKFVLSKAPAGKYRMVIWHEEGYVTGGKNGIEVDIPAGGKADVGEIKFKPSE